MRKRGTIRAHSDVSRARFQQRWAESYSVFAEAKLAEMVGKRKTEEARESSAGTCRPSPSCKRLTGGSNGVVKTRRTSISRSREKTKCSGHQVVDHDAEMVHDALDLPRTRQTTDGTDFVLRTSKYRAGARICSGLAREHAKAGHERGVPSPLQ